MAVTRPHTRDYPQEARQRLGVAVTRAREALGHPRRPSFVALLSIGIRSLVKLESGDPVGPGVYEAVARVLPNWTEDTPVTILEGGPVPLNDAQPASSAGWRPMLTDEQIIALTGRDLMAHYNRLEDEYGADVAGDWLVHVALVRRDARREARGTLAADGS